MSCVLMMLMLMMLDQHCGEVASVAPTGAAQTRGMESTMAVSGVGLRCATHYANTVLL